MKTEFCFEDFISSYPPEVSEKAILTRELILKTFPQVDEEVDQGAKIVGYLLGKGYKNTLCTIIPSQQGLKLGFYRGSEIVDPEKALIGSGSVHKHVVIKDFYAQRMYLVYLLQEAFKMWKIR